jgi:hypothetical protein
MRSLLHDAALQAIAKQIRSTDERSVQKSSRCRETDCRYIVQGAADSSTATSSWIAGAFPLEPPVASDSARDEARKTI